MKREFLIMAVTVSLVAGCSKQEDKAAAAPAKTNAPAGGNPLNAPADYLGGMVKAKGLAEKTVDSAGLNQAVQLFFAQEGRFPKDLDELVKQKYIPAVPAAPYGMKIQYDAAKGQVSIVKQQ